jgi:hypothetical protein
MSRGPTRPAQTARTATRTVGRVLAMASDRLLPSTWDRRRGGSARISSLPGRRNRGQTGINQHSKSRLPRLRLTKRLLTGGIRRHFRAFFPGRAPGQAGFEFILLPSRVHACPSASTHGRKTREGCKPLRLSKKHKNAVKHNCRRLLCNEGPTSVVNIKLCFSTVSLGRLHKIRKHNYE